MDLMRWRCGQRKQASQPRQLLLKIVLCATSLTLQCVAAQTVTPDDSLFSFSLGEEKSISATTVRPLPKDLPTTGSIIGCAPAPIPSPISLIDAVQHALCRNPQTRQAWASALGQAAGVGIARSAYLPTVTAGLSRTRDEPNTSLQASTTSKNVVLNYVLYDFGLRAANLEAAHQSLKAALSSQDAALQTVFAATTSAYYDAVTAKSSLLAALDAERAAQESWNAAQAKVKHGAGTPTDVMQARSAYSKAVLDRVKTEGGMLSARGALAFAMGLEAQTPLVLSEQQLSKEQAGSPIDFLLAVDEMIAQAKVSHPSIVAAQAQLKAAQARVASAEAEGRPTVSVSGARYLNGRPSTAVSSAASSETTYGITVNIPLFEGFGRGAKINAARAQVEGKATELSNAELQVSIDVWKAYQDLQSQSTALGASRDLLESATQAYAAIQARYRVGAAGIVDVLNTQSALANAQQQRVQTLGNWRAAQLKLLGSLGQLGFWALQR